MTFWILVGVGCYWVFGVGVHQAMLTPAEKADYREDMVGWVRGWASLVGLALVGFFWLPMFLGGFCGGLFREARTAQAQRGGKGSVNIQVAGDLRSDKGGAK